MMTTDVARGPRLLLQLVLAYSIAAGATAAGQAGAAPGAKAQEFDVVSIKPNHSGRPGGMGGVYQNEYTARSTSLSRIILQAYFPQVSSSSIPFFPPDERLKGAPSWVMTDPYDIVAKVDDATANSWKDLRLAQKNALAAPMLRAMLEDRCKLVVHTVPTEVQGYALVAGKHGMKMKEAQPGEPIPARAYKVGGDWMIVLPLPRDAKQSVTYLQITMEDFAAILNTGAVPIVDQTGLKWKYDFELPKIDTIQPEGGEGAAPPTRPDIAHMFNWGAIGLEMKPAKVPALNLVVDHIERPTVN